MPSRTDEPQRHDPYELADLVERLADRLHAGVDREHHVASPLGAWLVLALGAGATRGDARRQVEDALGCTAERSAEHLRALVAQQHPQVVCALAAWSRLHVGPVAHPLDGDGEDARLARWLRALPGPVEQGPVPPQDEADAWARERTLGLVERFPLDLSTAVLVLASAVATDVRWAEPFDAVPSSELGPGGPFAGRVARVLHARYEAHGSSVVDPAAVLPPRRGEEPDPSLREVGDVAVHVAHADGLDVVSVAAAPGVPRRLVLRAAHVVARATGTSRWPSARRSLFDLPLEGPLWTIHEEEAVVPGGRQERVRAVLPAWSARDQHDLLRVPGLGMDGLAAELVPALGGIDAAAAQAAVARFDRYGFAAAAVTGFAVRVSAQLSSAGLRRSATLRFAHPYAVVAVARPFEPGLEAWEGLPVASAWVARADEVQDEVRDEVQDEVDRPE